MELLRKLSGSVVCVFLETVGNVGTPAKCLQLHSLPGSWKVITAQPLS